MAYTQRRRIGLLGALVLCAAFVGFAAPVGAQAQQEPQIHFINPSDFAEDGMPPVISSQSTGGGTERPEATTYRLNAWTANAPTGALVEFEIDIGLDSVNIGTAQRLAGDVFEFDWDVDSDVAIDGQYTLRAILFSGVGAGAQELAQHEIDVLVQDNQSERSAADLTYPTNAGPAGFYTNPKSGSTNIMVDFAQSATTGGASASDSVYVYYTVSPSGDEPSWKRCDNETSTPAVCDLESIDQGGGAVTAVAAVSNEDAATGDEAFNAAGDAVRVLPYEQDASNIFVEPITQRENSDSSGDFGCTDTFEGFVVDRLGRPISDIPVDIHAQGPTDQLKFSNGDDATAPDEGHGGTEPVFDCAFERPVLLDLQADHNRPGEADVKHEEETDNSDSDDDNFGIFTVALHSPSAGATQITFWADEDDDDVYCSEEPAVAASVGWNQDAPPPTLDQPEKTDCPIPEPPQPEEPECSDGVDNDGDGQTDHPDDDGCDSPDDDDESDEGIDPRGCTIEGTDNGEFIQGTDGDDVICGNGGNDVIEGKGGNDVIFGDDGDDTIKGGRGDDTIEGGDGNDSIRGGSGSDTARGNRGDDTIAGGGGADNLRGNRGFDALRGGGGTDILRGSGGDDTLRGGRGRDTLNGGPGTDTCRGGRGRDRMTNCE